jgi:hypothetical protein
MATIINAISDVKDVVQGITGFCRIWNNQFQYMEEQQIESFPFPCGFVETLMPQTHSQLSSGYTESDVTFKIHIGAVEYDAQDGTLEQNTSVFALRDAVVSALTYYAPRGCSPLMKISEEQDYQHTNVYHFIINFQCGFVDSSGAKIPLEKLAPTDLETIVNYTNNINAPIINTFNVVQPTDTLAAYYVVQADGETTIYPKDALGNSISGFAVTSVQVEIKPLLPTNYTYDINGGLITFVNVELYAGQTIFVLYRKPIN